MATNKTVIRKSKDGGTFTSIPNTIILDKRLTSNAFRILCCILQDSDTHFSISLTGLRNRFGNAQNTLENAFKNMEQCGYLRRKNISKGKKPIYHYTFSEFGNLNTDKSKLKEIESVVEVSPTKDLQEKIEKNKNLLNDYLYKIEHFTLKDDSLTNNIIQLLPDYMKGEEIDFHPLKSKIEKKYIKPMQKKYYKELMEVTTGTLNGKPFPKNSINTYSKWLKEQIFTEYNLDHDFDSEFRKINRKLNPPKVDWETEAHDRAEEEYYDNQ